MRNYINKAIVIKPKRYATTIKFVTYRFIYRNEVYFIHKIEKVLVPKYVLQEMKKFNFCTMLIILF